MQKLNDTEPVLSPLISITVPAYKDTYLKECIESILSQTYSNYEIVIVNDASPYDLDAIVSDYTDARIRYYKNEKNCGAVRVVDNWNKCLEYAKGDYIICMGDDDVLLPHCIEEYVKLINKYPGLGVYHAWTEIIDEKSQFMNVTAARCEYESAYSFIWHRWNGRVQQYIGDFLFDTKILRKNGGFFFLPLAWGADDITAIIAAKEAGIANTQRPCFCYRINSSTISSTGDVDIKMEAIYKERAWYEHFLSSKPENEQDWKFWICIKRQFPLFVKKKKGRTIASDIYSHSLFRLFRWISKKKKYDISISTLLYAVIEAEKKRFNK